MTERFALVQDHVRPDLRSRSRGTTVRTGARLMSGTAAALALVAGLASIGPAAARDRISPGAAAAIGMLGGLAMGSAMTGARPQGSTPQTSTQASPPQQPQQPQVQIIYVPAPQPQQPPPQQQQQPQMQPAFSAPASYAPPTYVRRCLTEQINQWVPGWGWQTQRRTMCR